MNNSKWLPILLTILLNVWVNSSELVLNEQVKTFLSKTSTLSIYGKSNVTDAELLDTAQVSTRPVLYEVIIPPRTGKEIIQLSNLAGVPDSLRRFTGYDQRKGIYYYNSPHLKVMKNESASADAKMKLKAVQKLQQLLGKESSNFVFANTESDWIKTKSDPVERLLSQTYRFTRKVNGYHIIDNTSYVKITFTGDEELAGFEICNPELKPVPLKRMVKFSSTARRLQQFANDKNTVIGSFNEEINISQIKAEKAIQSYLSENRGQTKLLIPHISVYCKYHLANNVQLDRFENFVLDASVASNVPDDMLEPLIRK